MSPTDALCALCPNALQGTEKSKAAGRENPAWLDGEVNERHGCGRGCALRGGNAECHALCKSRHGDTAQVAQ
eukprot:3163176-Karenia_brevis.AAC.1